MLFLIEYESLPVTYRVTNNSESLVGFADYLKSLTGKDLGSLTLTFVDEENDTIVVKDQFDFDYFLENCICGSKVMRVRSNQQVANGALVVEEQPNSDQLRDSFEQAESTNAPVETEVIDFVDTELSCGNAQSDKVISNKPTSEKLGHESPFNELSDEKSPSGLTDNLQPSTEKGNAGSQIAQEKLKDDPNLIHLQQKIDHLGALVFDNLCQLSSSLHQLKQTQGEPIKAPTVTTTHHGHHCIDCRSNPIIGKLYACLTCPNFTLCENCHQKLQAHVHPMVVLAKAPNDLETLQFISKISNVISRSPKTRDICIKGKLIRLILGDNYCSNLTTLLLSGREHFTAEQFFAFLVDFFK
jgi:hypothetical protein